MPGMLLQCTRNGKDYAKILLSSGRKGFTIQESWLQLHTSAATGNGELSAMGLSRLVENCFYLEV